MKKEKKVWGKKPGGTGEKWIARVLGLKSFEIYRGGIYLGGEFGQISLSHE